MGVCPHCLTEFHLSEASPVFQRLTRDSNLNLIYGFCPACAAQYLESDPSRPREVWVTCWNNLTRYEPKARLAVVTDMAYQLAEGDFVTAFEDGAPLSRRIHDALVRGDTDYTILPGGIVVMVGNKANGVPA